MHWVEDLIASNGAVVAMNRCMMKHMIVFGAMLIGLVSCSGSSSYADWNDLDGVWTVLRVGTSIVDVPDESDSDSVPYVGFNSQDGTVYGSLGCNQLMGVRVVDPKHPECADFSALGTTLMLCDDMELEEMLLGALWSVVHYQIAPNGYLQLIDGDGAVLMELQRRP